MNLGKKSIAGDRHGYSWIRVTDQGSLVLIDGPVFDPKMTSNRPFMNFMTTILMIKADFTDISGHIFYKLTQYNSTFSDS